MGDPDELVAIWLGGLDGTTWFEQDADEPVYPASLVKVPIVTAAAGLDPAEPLPLHDDFASAAGGRYRLDRDDDQDDATWDALGASESPTEPPTETVGELSRRAIVVSSNLAANLLLERVGVPAVQRVLREAGCGEQTTVTRGLGDLAARDAGLTNQVTARDLGRVLAHTPEPVVEVMRGQTHRAGIPAGLPAGADVANKTGWVDGIAHDMALVRPGDGGAAGALVVLTRTGLAHDEAERRIAALAAQAWEHRR